MPVVVSHFLDAFLRVPGGYRLCHLHQDLYSILGSSPWALINRPEKKPCIVVGINIQEMRVTRGLGAAFLDDPSRELCVPQLARGGGKHSPDLERQERAEMS